RGIYPLRRARLAEPGNRPAPAAGPVRAAGRSRLPLGGDLGAGRQPGAVLLPAPRRPPGTAQDAPRRRRDGRRRRLWLARPAGLPVGPGPRRAPGRLALSPFLPAPGLFQCVGDLGRHVFLVVLGEHAGGGEDSVVAEPAFGDYPLPLAEQVGQDAGIGDLERGLAVGDAEIDLAPVAMDDAALFDEPADADAPPRRDVLCRQFARAV